MSAHEACHVLIMESDTELKNKLENAMSGESLTLLAADSIEAFYRLFLQRRPAVAFLDIDSSAYDGIKLAIGLNSLRIKMNGCRTSVVAISNFCTPSISMAYGRYGFDFVLDRPLDKTKLLRPLSRSLF